MSSSDLFHFRWSIPLLAELHRSGGSKFVTLATRLGAGRETTRRTLDGLIDSGLVARNPGYGHPLRPEYVLSRRGRAIGPACAALVDALRAEGLEDVGLKKWSIPIVLSLTRERRFAELRAALDVSPRALALALKDLADAELVERHVHDGFPPSTTYRLTRRAQRLRRLAAAL
jgi:DNA-binding HxlR family transcriptional regulator